MGPGGRREILRSAGQPGPDYGDELDKRAKRDEIQDGDFGADERGEDVGARAGHWTGRHRPWSDPATKIAP